MTAAKTSLREWRVRIAAHTTPLPGSRPYDNARPLRVPGRFDGWRLLRFLSHRFPHISRAAWELEVDSHLILRDGKPLKANEVVRAGAALVHLLPKVVEPPVDNDIRVFYEDDELLAVNKPAPLPVHPSGRFNKNTLVSILTAAHPEVAWRLPHRLDADTTGVQLIAKTQQAARALQREFEARRVRKIYVAHVRDAPPSKNLTITAPISKEPRHAGSRQVLDEGRRCVTRCRTLHRLDDGSALVRVEPLTGRTHQIRLHLQLIGCPIVGDTVYGDTSSSSDLPPQGPTRSDAFTTATGSLALHAQSIRLRHPSAGRFMSFVVQAPAWFNGESDESRSPKTGGVEGR